MAAVEIDRIRMLAVVAAEDLVVAADEVGRQAIELQEVLEVADTAGAVGQYGGGEAAENGVLAAVREPEAGGGLLASSAGRLQRRRVDVSKALGSRSVARGGGLACAGRRAAGRAGPLRDGGACRGALPGRRLARL